MGMVSRLWLPKKVLNVLSVSEKQSEHHYCLTPGGVKNVIYNFGCVKMQVLENGEN